MASDIDRIRLAVALSALKFKPLVQSFSAYVLDLRSQFPPSSPELTSTGSWQQLALSLERDFAALKEKYEAEQIRCLALEKSASVASVMPKDSSEQSAATKKKSKKKPRPSTAVPGSDKRSDFPPAQVDLKAIMEDFSIRPELRIPRISPSDSLFSSLDNFLRLTSLPEVEPDLLLSITLRTIEAAAQSLNSIVTPRTRNSSSDPNTLESLGHALQHVLGVALPLLASRTQTSVEPTIRLLDRTTTLVLNPLIHGFSAQSESYLNVLFLCPYPSANAVTAKSLKPPDASPDPLPVDVRTDMLSLFRIIFCLLNRQTQTLSALAKPCSVSHTLRASLMLETVREIDQLLSIASIRPLSDPIGDVSAKQYHQTRSVRVKKLAMKDSLWFLCTIFHTLLSESSGTTSCVRQPATVSVIPGRERDTIEKEADDAALERNDCIQGREERLLGDGVSDALVKLVTRCKRPASFSFQHSPQPTENLADGTSCLRVEKQRLVGQGGNDEEEVNLKVTDLSEIGDRDVGRDEGGGICGHAGRSIDVTVDTDVELGENAAGPLNVDTGRDHGAASVPQGASKLRNDRPFELDEVGYGMLLGVMERYWVWSKSREL